ncbi:hypothetical protein [Streptomyces sp. KMM 9044]|uniref:hypothetical protein n=1 Tax=Streptomyces sp. KMM 9044 TaxID=2744474 RepID=UPI00216C36F9|nr:hypothetical protein [Streptomyces sp. KMM 9044]WAX77381.1 hypothetical protein HUV60_006615 [Streptomyces sp. KMM 9044]
MPHDERAMPEPDMTPRVPLPLFRAAVFAVVSVVSGAGGHHLVAEGPVPWRQGGAAVAVLFAVALLGVRRPRSLATVTVVCAAAQVGLHLWLMAGHVHRTAPLARPGHVHHVADPAGVHPGWYEGAAGSPAMTGVHVLVAVLVAVLLHRADRVCWSPARGLTAAVGAARDAMTALGALAGAGPVPARWEPPAPPTALWPAPVPPDGAVLADVVSRRGPPRARLSPATRPCRGASR